MGGDPRQYGGGKGFRNCTHREPTNVIDVDVTPTCKGLDKAN